MKRDLVVREIVEFVGPRTLVDGHPLAIARAVELVDLVNAV